MRIQRELDEEHACKKRKQGAIIDLSVELEFSEPEHARVLEAMIDKIARMDVANFTANFNSANMGMSAPSATSPPVAKPVLPRFNSSLWIVVCCFTYSLGMN